MKIGYNKAIGIILILLALFNCCLGVILMQAEDGSMPAGVISGFAAALVFGILFLTRKYFEVEGNTLVVKALIGPLVKNYKFNSASDFTVLGTKISLSTNDAPKPIVLASWMADKRDWAALVKWIQDSK